MCRALSLEGWMWCVGRSDVRLPVPVVLLAALCGLIFEYCFQVCG